MTKKNLKNNGVNPRLNTTETEFPLSARRVQWVLFGVIIARILLTLLPSHKVDMGGYNYWSHYLSERGFQGFYESLHVVYAPVYMYLLLISGKIGSIFAVSNLTHEFLIKSWAVLFDFIGGYLIYLIGKKNGKPKLGFWVGIFYISNPAIFINSSIWGQFDSLLATILFAVVYCFCINKSTTAAVLYTIAILTKPQSISLFPLVFYLFFFQDVQWAKVLPFFRKKYWIKVLTGVIAVLFTYALIVSPFFKPSPNSKGNPLLIIIDLFLWVPRLYFKYVNDYPYATANGFNLWTILGGQIVPDSEPFFGLTYAIWSKVLLVGLWVYAIWALVKIKKSHFPLYYISYLLCFGFFMFCGRMHERYLVPALIFLVVCVLWDSSLWLPILILSISVLINQSYMYELAKKDFYWLPKDDNLALFIASISLIILSYSFYYIFKYAQQKRLG